MADSFIKGKEKMSFQQICLEHLKKILEISTMEFRGGYSRTIFQGNATVEEYVPDSRACYFQAVESLARVLIPHFDKAMGEAYEEYKEMKDNIHKEIIENYIETKEEINTEQEAENYVDRNSSSYSHSYSQKRLMKAHFLLEELSKLLKRNDYLKGSIYTEESID